jgi:hypothetical protein
MTRLPSLGGSISFGAGAPADERLLAVAAGGGDTERGAGRRRAPKLFFLPAGMLVDRLDTSQESLVPGQTNGTATSRRSCGPA